MQLTTIAEVASVQQEGSKWPLFWSWKEAGRQPVSVEQGARLGLPGEGWLLSEARWVTRVSEAVLDADHAWAAKRSDVWWIVCRRGDELAYGITPAEDGAYKAVEAIIDFADTKMTLSSMSR